VTDRRRIAQHYARGWFAFDLLSSVPYEQIVTSASYGLPVAVSLLKVWRWLWRSERGCVGGRAANACVSHPLSHVHVRARACRWCGSCASCRCFGC
jgi:hypothetical protein